MKLLTLIKLEFYKQKKGWLWLFLLIIPAGTTLAMFLDFTIRYDYLYQNALHEGYTSWDVLLIENHRVLGWGMFLPMFIGIIYALLYQVEEGQSNWKQYLSLPVRKESVYLSKFLAGFLFSFLLIMFNMLGLIFVGFVIGFPEAVEWGSYGRYAANQAVMILAVASLHNWLSSYFKNNIIPIVIGFAGVIVSSMVIFMLPKVSKFFPYALPFYTDGLFENSSELIPSSLLLMLVFVIGGLWHFNQKDVL
ncbi:hypothetical protein WQ54_14270 [Bacillus sp. SA1-12]|uniref:ABC transporter permease n=1 Tax=Bacillus sp. SA1-12 TaxID=1455638 RepID=UPI0006267636|nr:ABC transporter permease [Bacillus sp. SA1-12]KKI91554.1 hypothetical protein WQ54_14270 [Bacillus sp. SA1-12]